MYIRIALVLVEKLVLSWLLTKKPGHGILGFVFNGMRTNAMKTTLFNVIQIASSVLLIVVILLQQKGSGLSGVFGGSSNIYSTKRGFDKILHYATIILACIFFGVSLLRLFL